MMSVLIFLAPSPSKSICPTLATVFETSGDPIVFPAIVKKASLDNNRASAISEVFSVRENQCRSEANRRFGEGAGGISKGVEVANIEVVVANGGKRYQTKR